MSKNADWSRRDWFRLKKSRDGQMLTPLAQQSNSSSETEVPSPTMKSIEHPPNHDGMDLSELPPMREATLTSEQVADLFLDVAELATDVMLMQLTLAGRAAASRVSTSAQLQAARESLLDGNLPRLQLRYRWNDAQWIDTLKQVPEGFHLVRIAHAR